MATPFSDGEAVANEILQLWKKSALILIRSASACYRYGNGSDLMIAASLQRSNKRGNSPILTKTASLLCTVCSGSLSPMEDPLQILINHIASRILYETHAQILWPDTEYEWAMNLSNPATPNLEELCSYLKESEADLDLLGHRSAMLTAVLDKTANRAISEKEELVARMWDEPGVSVSLSVEHPESWTKMVESYVTAMEHRISSLHNPGMSHMADLLAVQLGVLKDNVGKSRCTLVEWLRMFTRGTSEKWDDMKQMETNACNLGKAIALLLTNLLYAVGENTTLIEVFRRWRVSLSTLVWQQSKIKPDAVLLQRIVEALRFAETQLKGSRRSRHQHLLEEKIGKGKMPGKSKKKQANNILTKGQLHHQTMEMGEVLGNLKCQLMRLEICLTQPIWLQRASNQTDQVSATVKPFLSECSKNIRGLNRTLMFASASANNVSVECLRCTSKKIEELFKDDPSA